MKKSMLFLVLFFSLSTETFAQILLSGKVTHVEGVYESVQQPYQVCGNQQVASKQGGDSGSRIVGGAVGGFAGSSIGKGSGRDAAAGVGAVLGQSLGSEEGLTGNQLIGGVIGGLIGNKIGKGSGKTAATAAGALAGSMIASPSQKPRTVYRTVRVCEEKYKNVTVQTGYKYHVQLDGTNVKIAYDTNNRVSVGDIVQVPVTFGDPQI